MAISHMKPIDVDMTDSSPVSDHHILDSLRTDFVAGRKRWAAVDSGLSNTFYASNDIIPILEYLPGDINKKKQEKGGVVNIVVAESDIFSILDKMEGDFIICDVDRQLLKFINAQKLFLLEQFEKYQKNIISFKQVESNWEAWVVSHNANTAVTRRSDLGRHHFLFNEEIYCRSMEALKNKKIITLDINLFDKDEQNLLCKLLREYDLSVKLFNATNLPDYDGNNALVNLFQNLPWANGYVIQWNIHDRGPLDQYDSRNIDHYSQYVFSARSYTEYAKHLSQRPLFYAELDSHLMPLFMQKTPVVEDDDLVRFNVSGFSRDQKNDKYRKDYLEHLHKSTTPPDAKAFCEKFSVVHAPRNLHSIDSLIEIESKLTRVYRSTASLLSAKEHKQKKANLDAKYIQLTDDIRKLDLRDEKDLQDLKKQLSSMISDLLASTKENKQPESTLKSSDSVTTVNNTHKQLPPTVFFAAPSDLNVKSSADLPAASTLAPNKAFN